MSKKIAAALAGVALLVTGVVVARGHRERALKAHLKATDEQFEKEMAQATQGFDEAMQDLHATIVSVVEIDEIAKKDPSCFQSNPSQSYH